MTRDNGGGRLYLFPVVVRSLFQMIKSRVQAESEKNFFFLIIFRVDAWSLSSVPIMEQTNGKSFSAARNGE